MNQALTIFSVICFGLLSVIMVNLVLIPVSTTSITEYIPQLAECGIISMVSGACALVILKIKAIK